MADIRSLIAGDDGQTATAVVPPSPPAAPPVVTSAKSAALPAPVKQASTIQRIKPTAAQMAEVQANNDADLKGVAESKRQQALAIAQQMAGHIQRNDTASATAAAAQLGALNREIQAIGGTPVPMPGAMPIAQGVAQGVAPVAAPVVAPTDARALIAGDGTIVQQTTQPPPPSPVAKHFMDAFNTIQNAKRDIGQRIAGGIDTAYSVLPVAAGAATQAIATPFVGPARAEKMGTELSQFIGQPAGKALGITNQPAYQQPVGPIPSQLIATIKDFATKQGLTADQISAKTGIPPESVRNIATMASFAIPEVVGMVAKPVVAAAREAMPMVVDAQGNVISRAGQPRPASNATIQQVQAQFAKKQAAAQAAERPTDFGAAYAATAEPPLFKPPVELTPDENGVYREKPPLALPGPFGEEPVAAEAPPVAAEMPASVGAAGVTHENAVRAALAEARPDLQASLANKAPSEITPEELSAIQIHNKFAQVDPEFIPTEGQATQDIAKLSDEYNLKAQPGYEDLRKKFEERDPYLIKGFNNVKEQFAPDSTGVGQQGKANNVLENVKTNNVDVDNANIKNAYDNLNDTNGNFAVDMQQAALNGLQKVELTKRTNRIPKELKDTLDAYANGSYQGSGIDFENLRTDIASDTRKAQKAGDGTQVHVLNLLRDAIEELPMKDANAIEFKDKADYARSLFKQQKDLLDPEKPTFNKLYSLAYEDNRTPVEIETGNVPHPASKNFFENFVTGNKATAADLSRAIELVGKDSPAHHEIISGLVDYLKQKSGVIDDKGNVSQLALRKELNKLGPNLDLVAGSEVANRLRNIGDVAELSEHVRNRGGGSANVSQTAITSERQAGLNAAKEMALGLGETAANVATGGKSGVLLSVMKPMFRARQERMAQEAADAARRAQVTRIISPAAGIQLKDMLPPNTKD